MTSTNPPATIRIPSCDIAIACQLYLDVVLQSVTQCSTHADVDGCGTTGDGKGWRGEGDGWRGEGDGWAGDGDGDG